MTKIEKIKAEIEKRKEETKSRIAELGTFESERIGLYNNLEIYNDVLSYIDSMQEESDTSVWHSKNEEPLEDKQVLIDINGFCFVDFYHKKDKRFYMFMHPRHYLHEIDKWAYVDDFFNTSNLETTRKPYNPQKS